MKPPRLKPRTAGFSMLESAGFLIAIIAIGAYSWPRVTGVMKETEKASQFHAVCALESAKNQFDQDARPDDKRDFDAAGDADRFDKLSKLLTPNTPAAFQAAYSLNNIKVNELGKNVEVE